MERGCRRRRSSFCRQVHGRGLAQLCPCDCIQYSDFIKEVNKLVIADGGEEEEEDKEEGEEDEDEEEEE